MAEETRLYSVGDRCGRAFAAVYLTTDLPGEEEVREFLRGVQEVAVPGHGTLVGRDQEGWSIEGGGPVADFPEADVYILNPLPPSPARAQ